MKNDIPGIQIGRSDDAAYLAGRTVMIGYRNIPGIKRIRNRAFIHPSGNTADDVASVVDGTCIIGFLHCSGETAHDAPYMAGIIGKGLIADLAFIVYIIQ